MVAYPCRDVGLFLGERRKQGSSESVVALILRAQRVNSCLLHLFLGHVDSPNRKPRKRQGSAVAWNPQTTASIIPQRVLESGNLLLALRQTPLGGGEAFWPGSLAATR